MSAKLPSEDSADEALRPLNEQVTDVLVANHRRFRSFLAKRVGSSEVAEDLLQSSLRKAFENPTHSKAEQTIVAWFYTVLKNSLTDYYRSRSSEVEKTTQYSRELDLHGKVNEASPDEIEAAICECMNDLLPTLNPAYVDLIRRIDLKGEQPRDVATELNITENNLNVRLHRARSALKTSLERSCGTCTEHGCLNCTCE